MPRILVQVAEGRAESVREGIAQWAGTSKFVEKLDLENLQEWDVLITDVPQAEITQAAYVIAMPSIPTTVLLFNIFGSRKSMQRQFIDATYATNASGVTGGAALALQTGIRGHEVFQTEELPQRLKRLVRDSLVPAIEKRESQFALRFTDVTGGVSPALVVQNLRPFLVGPQAHLLALSYNNYVDTPRWFVPFDVKNLADWIDCALAEWSENHPERFPRSTRWRHSRRWMNASERATDDLISDTRIERETALQEIDGRLALLEEQALAARGMADMDDRLLITGQGPELENAVSRALLRFGFRVEAMDPKAEAGALQEDFRVTDPEDIDFIAILEVTGSIKGIPEEKLRKLVRHVSAFVRSDAQNRTPTPWLVANQFMETDPFSRYPLFREETIKDLAENGELAIESPALFILLRALDDGVPNSDIRRFLRSSVGRLSASDAVGWISDGPVQSPEDQSHP